MKFRAKEIMAQPKKLVVAWADTLSHSLTKSKIIEYLRRQREISHHHVHKTCAKHNAKRILLI